jgi:hypothetical protein
MCRRRRPRPLPIRLPMRVWQPPRCPSFAARRNGREQVHGRDARRRPATLHAARRRGPAARRPWRTAARPGGAAAAVPRRTSLRPAYRSSSIQP